MIYIKSKNFQTDLLKMCYFALKFCSFISNRTCEVSTCNRGVELLMFWNFRFLPYFFGSLLGVNELNNFYFIVGVFCKHVKTWLILFSIEQVGTKRDKLTVDVTTNRINSLLFKVKENFAWIPFVTTSWKLQIHNKISFD